MEFSEEEKKALEILKEIKDVRGIRQDVEGENEDLWALDIVYNLTEKLQKEIYRLQNIKRKDIEELINNEKENIYINYISKDKIRKYFMHEIAFKKRLQREKQKIDKYNRGRFDTIEEILELLEEN